MTNTYVHVLYFGVMSIHFDSFYDLFIRIWNSSHIVVFFIFFHFVNNKTQMETLAVIMFLVIIL